MFMFKKFFIGLALASSVCASLFASITIPKAIDERSLVFPQNFKWGSACAAYQDFGSNGGQGILSSGKGAVSASQWSRFETLTVGMLGSPTVAHGEQSRDGNGGFEKAFEDIRLMTDMGFNTHRFSLDWSFFQPTENGGYNPEAFKFYHDYINALIAAGIEPNITLHHFVHPQWFEEKGAFEKIENLHYFVNFAVRMFTEFGSKVRLWVTINEPTVYATQGYGRGVFPPGKQDARLAGLVMRNMMRAHVQIYRTLKRMPNGDRAQIGIVHQFLKSETTAAGAVLFGNLAQTMNMYFHKAVFGFLQTGIFDFYVDLSFPPHPITCLLFGTISAHVHDENIKAPGEKILDFLGINYYSVNLFGAVGPTCNAGEYMTDMPYRGYPQGLYDAIKEGASLGVPMYITENGISDVKDIHREEWIQTYLYAVNQAMKEGCDVRGFYYWSFMDNFEWDMGYDQHFGLYAVDFKTKVRTLREGSKAYQRIIALNRARGGAQL